METSAHPQRPSLLAGFSGERPPAPEWFINALAEAPERSTFEHDGAAIELLTWGEVGKPGLLFLHGNAAHADWWSFIAPYFTNDYRCAAISWSGMGRSAWRSHYSIPTYAEEALQAARVAGLDASGQPPVLVGHSFGSFPLLYIAARNPSAMSGAVLIDALAPRSPLSLSKTGLKHQERDLPTYPTQAAALARFRFMPEQDCDMPAVADFIARASLHQTGEQTWTWRFDPRIWSKLNRTHLVPELAEEADVPLGLIYGEDSIVVTPERLRALQGRLKDCRFITAIPHARHHIMVDQPIALIAALRAGLITLSATPSSPSDLP